MFIKKGRNLRHIESIIINPFTNAMSKTEMKLDVAQRPDLDLDGGHEAKCRALLYSDSSCLARRPVCGPRPMNLDDGDVCPSPQHQNPCRTSIRISILTTPSRHRGPGNPPHRSAPQSPRNPQSASTPARPTDRRRERRKVSAKKVRDTSRRTPGPRAPSPQNLDRHRDTPHAESAKPTRPSPHRTAPRTGTSTSTRSPR